jgi:TRAP-type C4-dicarboxylate transport system permease small subunit
MVFEIRKKFTPGDWVRFIVSLIPLLGGIYILWLAVQVFSIAGSTIQGLELGIALLAITLGLESMFYSEVSFLFSEIENRDLKNDIKEIKQILMKLREK